MINNILNYNKDDKYCSEKNSIRPCKKNCSKGNTRKNRIYDWSSYNSPIFIQPVIKRNIFGSLDRHNKKCHRKSSKKNHRNVVISKSKNRSLEELTWQDRY